MNTMDCPTSLDVVAGLNLRRATLADADLLTSWLNDPAVFTWWGGRPIAGHEVAAKYTDQRADVASYVIEEAGLGVGYIQAWQDGDGMCGLDMFVAGPAQGRGIGPQVAQALAVDLSRRGWDQITADPAVANLRAIRTWERAGFVDTGRLGDDDGIVTRIMVFAARASDSTQS